MYKLANFLGAVAFLLGLSPSSYAILNGEIVDSKEHSTIKLKVISRGFSELCSGVFIASNTLITAAHCFDDHMEALSISDEKIFSNKFVTISINDSKAPAPYKVFIHPQYMKSKLNDKNYRDSNHDLAAVIFKKEIAPKTLPLLLNSRPLKNVPVKVLGFGMSVAGFLQDGDDTFSTENDSGALRQGEFLLSHEKNGLFYGKAKLKALRVQKFRSPAGFQSAENSSTGHSGVKSVVKNETEYQFLLEKGVQILGADSGGPVIQNGKLIGIIRNYRFSFNPKDLEKVDSPRVRGESIFTALTTKNATHFLKSLKQFGSKLVIN